jgi:NDP-mannose synthase
VQAIILAGGKGTRLKPYTTVLPKPLMPVGDYPILEILIRQLAFFGVDRIVVAVGHLKELIQAFLGDGERWKVRISYSFEDQPLGTAGPLKRVPRVDEDFLVMNGDVLTNLNFRKFFETHQQQGNLCTIATYAKPVAIDLGVLSLNDANEVIEYIEKPTLHYQVSTGVYAFNKKILDYIPGGEYFDFPELIMTLLRDGKTVKSYPFNGLWLDIGRTEDYTMANQAFETHQSELLHI